MHMFHYKNWDIKHIFIPLIKTKSLENLTSVNIRMVEINTNYGIIHGEKYGHDKKKKRGTNTV